MPIESARLSELAKRAAWQDLRNDRQASPATADWWAGELSHELGIVNRKGMIDVAGETATAFKREYLRVWRRDR